MQYFPFNKYYMIYSKSRNFPSTNVYSNVFISVNMLYMYISDTETGLFLSKKTAAAVNEKKKVNKFSDTRTIQSVHESFTL